MIDLASQSSLEFDTSEPSYTGKWEVLEFTRVFAQWLSENSTLSSPSINQFPHHVRRPPFVIGFASHPQKGEGSNRPWTPNHPLAAKECDKERASLLFMLCLSWAWPEQCSMFVHMLPR